MEESPAATGTNVTLPTGIKTFLIADVRGSTGVTEQHGDDVAARLAQRFANLARTVVDSHGGAVLDARGDEVLAVFALPHDAVRAAVALQDGVRDEERREDSGVPFVVGVGIDVGEAVQTGEGYRGRALNMAARLCARAAPGEILVTPEVADLAGAVDGLAFEDRGPVRLSGLTRPVHVHAVVRSNAAAVRVVGAGRGMEFRVLGPVEVLDQGRPVALGGPRQRLVLAHLVLEANHVVSVDHLIERVWGDEAPSSARGTVQAYVSHLRAALGADRIEGKAPGYVLHAEPDEIDVLRFERILRRAHRQLVSDPRGAVGTFDEAMALWRGAPMGDLEGAASLAGDVARLEALRVAAGEDRIGALLDLGEHADIIAELETLTVRHPLRERLWAQLMLALYRSGRQADALEAFGRARRTLADELGIDPSRELRELHERILKQDPTLDLSGKPLRSYRLLDEIGEGAFAVVWRAYDPGVGREVAIKQIRSTVADDPAFVRRFDREARIVARLEHPHVVPLYDSWRDGGGAYLVMRLMRGGSLADAIAAGRLSLDDAAIVADHVASALSAAHRRGLVHRDVKPENVLLDEEGNAYLSDFGIALRPDEAAPDAVASPSTYESPEMERGEPATPQSDIFALGRVLERIAAGSSAVPPAVSEVLARATAAVPADRYADARDLAEAFRAAIGPGGRRVAEGTTVRNPYKGLRPFSEADAGDFFGREGQVERLLARLREPGPRFLAVVGPSGGGKSSVVRAGLLPALRAGALPGSEGWFQADLLPGPRPMEELEAALVRAAPEPPPSLLDVLERDERGLVRAVDRILPEAGTQLLVVVDQFEELFTLGADERTRTEFLEVLTTAVDDPTGRVWVVLTLRADHYDRPLSYAGFAELLRARTEPIVPLSPAELERAIAGPAEGVGVVPELALVAEMVADVTDQPGALPLMQFALTETFERRRGGVLTLEAYREVGGVAGAVARRAEHLYGRMNEAGREAARQLFLRLVSVGEGAEDTRRLVPRAELASLEVDADAMDGVIDAFGRHRLLSFDRDPDTRGPTVEVAHEALLREWTRLRGWIDASREDVITHRRLAGQAEEWERSERDPSFLVRGGRLLQIEAWAETTGLALSATERGYVGESVRAGQVEQAEEERRAARERALERRSVRRLQAIVVVLTVAALVAAGLTVIALGQRSDAERQARVAAARELAAAAMANLTVDPQRSVLLALQAMDTTRADGTVLPEAVDALHAAVAQDREILTLNDPSTANVTWSPNGLLLATGGTAGGLVQSDVLLWDAETGALLHRLKGHTADIANLAFSADSSRLVTIADDRQVIEWDTATGEIVWRRHFEASGGVSFSPDGSVVAVATGPPGYFIRILDAATGTETERWVSDGVQQNPSFSPDGALVAGANGGAVVVWNAGTGRFVRSASPRSGGCDFARYSSDGSRLACVGGGHITVFDGATGREELSFPVQPEVFGMDWSRDGTMFATGSPDGTAKLWDAATGDERLTLYGHSGLVALVAFSPDGTRLLTGGADGTARVWDIRQDATAELFGDTGPDQMFSVAYSRDGTQLLSTGSGPGNAYSWLRNGSTGAHVRGLPTAWNSGLFSPDGSRLLLAGERLEIVDASPGGSITPLCDAGGCGFGYYGIDWSANGSRVAAGVSSFASKPATAQVWEAESGDLIGTFGGPLVPGDSMNDVALSPDGALVAGIDQRAILRLWNVDTGKQLFRIPTGPSSGIGLAVAFSPDGKTVATAGGNGAATWSVPSGKRVETFNAAGKADSVAYSADGTMLAVGWDDGMTRVWDVSSGRLLQTLPGHTDQVTGVAFSPDGSALATASHDGTLRVYALRVADLVRLARSRLTRGLSPAECRQYLHTAHCPVSARGPAPSPAPSGATAVPKPAGPEGAYWKVVSQHDLASPDVPPDSVRDNAGTYTLSLAGGVWRLHQRYPDGRVWDGSGPYSIDGSRLTLTLGTDSECFGGRISANWNVSYATLTLTNVSESGPCSDDAEFRAVDRALYAVGSWAPAL